MCATALLKAKMFKAFAIYFSVYLGYGLNFREKVIFCPNYFVSVLLNYFAIVVIINKACKLFQLVLVVYCDSC